MILLVFEPRDVGINHRIIPSLNHFPHRLRREFLHQFSTSVAIPKSPKLDLTMHRAIREAINQKYFGDMGDSINWVGTWSDVKDSRWMNQVIGEDKM
jgi:hypothetical protein